MKITTNIIIDIKTIEGAGGGDILYSDGTKGRGLLAVTLEDPYLL